MKNDRESITVVHRYFTPFALALLTLALLISRPPEVYAIISYGVLIFAAAFNWLTERWARNPVYTARVKEMRVGVNVAINSCLVYLLLSFWRPIWLLYVLTPVAIAVYEGKRAAVQMAVGLGTLLVWAYYVNLLRSPADYAEAGAYAAFIVFISLFVSQIAHAKRA